MTQYFKSLNEAWGLTEPDYGGGEDYIPAFFNIEDITDEDLISEWMTTAITTLENKTTDFARKAIENVMFLKGYSEPPEGKYTSFQEASRSHLNNDVSLNIVYEFVELWTNRLASFPVDLSVTPSTNNSSARDNAEAKELALKDYFHKNKLKQLFTQFDRQCFTVGESYLHIYWNQDKGPLHPAFKSIAGKYKAFKRVMTASGEEVNVNRVPRIGDVQVDIVPGINVLFEEKAWELLDYIIIKIPTNIDKLRSDYQDVELDGSGDIPCYWMYHLPTKYLPEGRFVKFAAGEVLENVPFPLPKPTFPVVRMTNIDVIGASRGKSFIENIKSHQILINKVITEVWNNLRRSARGKWIAPAKSMNPAHLHPNSPAIEYIGSVAPQFVTYPGLKPENIQFIQLLREYAEKQARIQGITQGTPPANVRSGLQFAQLEEMEKRSVEITVAKKYAAVEEAGEIIALVMGKHYKPEDGRQITIFGKDKEYLVKALKVDAIREDHSVRVKTDDLPVGKVSQMSFFSEIRNQFGPGVVPDELMIDMLDSGRFNQYTEFGGATVETTLAQISKMIEGERPEPPGEYEDLILKWKILVGTMRKRSFLSYDEKVKKIFEEVVYTIEDMIVNKINPSMALQETLQTLPFFPVYYRPDTFQFAPPEAPMVGGIPQPKKGLSAAPELTEDMAQAADEALVLDQEEMVE